MTPHEALLALSGLAIEQVEVQDDRLTIHARTQSRSAACPDCGHASHRVHSLYTRRPADLPVANRPVRLALCVKRFRCGNSACPRLTFAERLPDFLGRYS
jgi:transposase